MHYTMTPVVLTLTLMTGFSNALFFGSKKTCYDKVGCFDTASPFDNALGYLPQSPEHVNANFKLYTRHFPESGKVISEADPGSAAEAQFDAEKPTKFIVHGYESTGDLPWVLNMSRMFLKKEDCNVVAVDWRDGAHAFYPQAVANTRMTAAVTANLINMLKDHFDLDLKSVHLIGHSLGAQTCGYIGHRVPGIGRITGLDPAGPLFEKTNPLVRLDPSDALFVDAIHTDGLPVYDLGLGTLQESGHLDFYPNGGTRQPACPRVPVLAGAEDVLSFRFKDVTHSMDCSHTRAYLLFTESIVNDQCQFVGYPCASKEQFEKGECTSCGAPGCPSMGYPATKLPATPGKYFLKTAGKEPFCLPQ